MEFELDQGIAILERTPRTLVAMLAALAPAWTDATEGPETWSPCRDGQLQRSVTFDHEVIGYRRAVTTGPSTGWRSSAWGVRTGSLEPRSCFRSAYLICG